MKLELKHLAPYLPYGLKCEILNYKCDYVGDKYDTIKGYYFYGDSPYFNFKHGRDHAGKNTTNFKPILRPLSDLTQEDLIDDLGTTISHLDWVTNEREHWIKFYSREHWLNDIPYVIYNYLIKNHFDVFGLIEKGLAIDINTLKP